MRKRDRAKLAADHYNRPRTWVVAYFVTILAFACLYRMEIDGFFHSTVRYETSTMQQHGHLTRLLTEAIVAQLGTNGREKPTDNGRVRLTDDWELLVGDIQVQDLVADQDGITYTVRAASAAPDGITTVQNWFYLAMSMQSNALRLTTYPGGRERVTRITKVQRQAVDPGPPHVFDVYPPVGTGSDDPTIAYVDMSPDLESELIAFHAAINGLPAGIRGGFWRMLYLSAGTIATLGIGDILPIRSMTRILVAAESMIGIVIAGLFINSLFRSSRKAPSHTTLVGQGKERANAEQRRKRGRRSHSAKRRPK